MQAGITDSKTSVEKCRNAKLKMYCLPNKTAKKKKARKVNDGEERNK